MKKRTLELVQGKSWRILVAIAAKLSEHDLATDKLRSYYGGLLREHAIPWHYDICMRPLTHFVHDLYKDAEELREAEDLEEAVNPFDEDEQLDIESDEAVEYNLSEELRNEIAYYLIVYIYYEGGFTLGVNTKGEMRDFATKHELTTEEATRFMRTMAEDLSMISLPKPPPEE